MSSDDLSQPVIGVLALQGAFHLHQKHISAAGGQYLEVTSPEELKKCDGLIIPGGESATFLKLIEIQNLEADLLEFLSQKPVWGICAGAILLSKTVRNPEQKSLDSIDVSISRNAYGRQLDSFQHSIEGYEVSFIRAPVIEKTGEGVKVHALVNNHPVWVEKANITLTTFHSELNDDAPSLWHRNLIAAARSDCFL
jgi:5'-phosphate synthase pdxT subunit